MGTVSRPEMATLSSHPTSRVNNYQKIDIASLWKKRGALFTVASVILMFTSGIFGAQAAAVAVPKPVCPTQQPLVPFQDRISVCFHPEEYINQIPHDLEQLGSLIPPVREELERAWERLQNEKNKLEVNYAYNELGMLVRQEERCKQKGCSLEGRWRDIPLEELFATGRVVPKPLWRVRNPTWLLSDLTGARISQINYLRSKINHAYAMKVYQAGIQNRTDLEKMISIEEKEIKHYQQIAAIRKEEVAILERAFPFERALRYLDANKVGQELTQRSLIASRAPLSRAHETFWRAIFESRATIFDLTVDGEIEKYYPEELNEIIRYGVVSVKLTEKGENVFTYEVKNIQTGEVKNIRRSYHSNWLPNSISLHGLETLVKQAESLSPDPKDLVWIHCRAGVVRSGTFTAALILKEKIESGEVTHKNLEASLQKILVGLNKQRGFSFGTDLLYRYAYSLMAQKSESKTTLVLNSA